MTTNFKEFAPKFQQLKDAIGQVIIGQEKVIEDLLIVTLCGGHALIEGAPGLGKTRLVKAFAEATRLNFGRIQFTPDLMPADITGTTVLLEDEGKRYFDFQKGPVFTNLLLADEINRATPKTQSALLEAMQEHSVTVSGTAHYLPKPFITLATQNPFEMEGTYTLPEAQLDRFLFKILIEKPDSKTLQKILFATTGVNNTKIEPIYNKDSLLKFQEVLRAVPIANKAIERVADVIEATHNHPLVLLGASPRGAQAIVLAAKGYALANGRPNVEFLDIHRAALPALRHRVLLEFEDEAKVTEIIAEILAKFKWK